MWWTEEDSDHCHLPHGEWHHGAIQSAGGVYRTGQDRTGQDRTGQDRTGQDIHLTPDAGAHGQLSVLSAPPGPDQSQLPGQGLL